MSEHTTKLEVTLRDGTVLPKGLCTIQWKNGYAYLWGCGKRYGVEVHFDGKKINPMTAAKMLGISIPDEEQLEEWVVDSVCESVLGYTVEPDGIDEEGSPSWLMAMGMI
jgi:hypothetical protein